jgi:predicted ArsR family transcriptional regulator
MTADLRVLVALRKLQDAEDGGGIPADEIAEEAELPASEVEQTLRRLISRGLVPPPPMAAFPAGQGSPVSPLYRLSEKGRDLLAKHDPSI